MIPDTVLVVAEPFGALSAERVASALARGLRRGDGGLAVDAMTVDERQLSGRGWWERHGSVERLRAARAVAIASPALDEHTLAGSVAFELATSARQAGVPAYAVTADNRLDLFDARMLDLQAILRARSEATLEKAGRRLAQLV